MEMDAFLQGETDEEAQKAYKFFMRPDPDQRKFMGEMTEEFDPVTERIARYRMARVGMVRNAKEEDMREVKVYLGFGGKPSLPHIRLDKGKDLQGWYQSKHQEKAARERPCFTDAVLTEPYGGYCTVGCAFCYVNSGFRGYRGSGLISVPMGYGDQVAKQLKSMRTSAAGYFSSFTDPFIPLEQIYHNTENGARAFVREGLPVFFLSRLPYPGWAFDLLSQNRYSYAQKSINTPHQDDWEKLSPAAASLDQHFAEIRELRRRGIYVSIQVNPIIAGVVTHEDIELLFEKLAEAGANHVIVKFVEAGYSWAPAMVERITKRFGENRAASFRDLFVENQGGQKTVAEEYRMEGHRRYQKKATSLGLTYATCYEYEYERDEAGNITSKMGRSVGKKFLTADQCHGQRVPMFVRPASGEAFRELSACAPTGCLSCADDNGGKPRCGSSLLGSAKALRLVDFRADPGVKIG